MTYFVISHLVTHSIIVFEGVQLYGGAPLQNGVQDIVWDAAYMIDACNEHDEYFILTTTQII